MIRWTVDDALKSASLWLTQQAREELNDFSAMMRIQIPGLESAAV
uniref:Uncharacterized protein n=1 Tax=Anguilla anguilla TaxID=7936 RepID=A0A0E9X5Y9_ANGAN